MPPASLPRGSRSKLRLDARRGEAEGVKLSREAIQLVRHRRPRGCSTHGGSPETRDIDNEDDDNEDDDNEDVDDEDFDEDVDGEDVDDEGYGRQEIWETQDLDAL